MLRRLTVLLAAAVTFTLLPLTAAHAGSESDSIARVNGARTSRGLRAYAVRSDLTTIARRHAARMASSNRVYHNARLGWEVTGWRAIGENVGRGSSAAAIHNAFMASSAHRPNILSRAYTQIGVGAARSSNGTLYIAQVFRQPSAGSTTTYTRPATRPTANPQAPVRRASVAPRRASRSGVRRAPAAVAAPRPVVRAARPARPRPAVDPTPARLRAAVAAYREDRPGTALEHAVSFLRTNRMIAGG